MSGGVRMFRERKLAVDAKWVVRAEDRGNAGRNSLGAPSRTREFMIPSFLCLTARRFYKNGEWQEVVTDTRVPCANTPKSKVRAACIHCVFAPVPLLCPIRIQLATLPE